MIQALSGTYPADMGTRRGQLTERQVSCRPVQAHKHRTLDKARSTNRMPRMMLGDLRYTDGDGAIGCDGGWEGTSIRGGFVMNGYLKFYVQIRCTIWLFIVRSSHAGDAHEFLEFCSGDGLVANAVTISPTPAPVRSSAAGTVPVIGRGMHSSSPASSESMARRIDHVRSNQDLPT